MHKVNQLPQNIDIGYVGEQLFRPIEIDMTPWMAKMPNGVPSIVHTRPGESDDDAYIAATTFENNVLTWTISASDLGSDEGVGIAQVWLEEEENNTLNKRGMSAVFATIIHGSVGNQDPVVPPSQLPWLQQMTGLKTATVVAAAEAQAAQEAAESAQEAAETAQGAAETAQEAAETAQGKAEDAQEAAETSEENSEAWAVGQRDGVDVGSSDPTYHNNSKYYAGQAADSASTASAASTAASGAKDDAVSAKNAAVSAKNDAVTAKNDAVTAKNAAVSAKETAESWATGGSSGTPSASNNAKYYSEQAASSATTASTKAGEASGSATTASNKAGEAATSATSAETQALKAEGFAVGEQNGTDVGSGSPYYHNNAEYYAGQASGSATTATTQAGNASGSATTAGNKALVAEGFANGEQNGTPVSSGDYYHNNAKYFSEQAADSATAAAGSADDAADSAAEAEAIATMVAPVFDVEVANPAGSYVTKDGVLYYLPDGHEEDETWANTTKEETNVTEDLAGVKSAITQEKAPVILDTASGEIVTIPDGADGLDVKTLTVAIEPSQDLHGQANPYPGGGGKNQYNTADTAWTEGVLDDDGQPVSTTASHYTTNYTKVKSGTAYILSGSISAPNVQVRIYFYTSGKTWISRTSGTSATTCTFTTPATCEYIRIQCGATITATTDWQVEEGSTATAWSPYSNICPISGFTGANVARTGVNVWDEKWESNGSRIYSKNLIPVLPGTTYAWKAPYQPTNGLSFYDKDETLLSTIYSVTNYSDGWGTFTTPSNCYYIWFAMAVAYGTTYNNDISINYPSTDHEYHPGHVAFTSYPFPSQAGTVYGGTLTVNEDGSVTLVSQFEKRKMTAIDWSYSSGSQRFESEYMTSEAANAVLGEQTVYCSCYKAVPNKNGSSYSNGEIGFNSLNVDRPYLIVKDSRYTSKADFVASLTDDDEIIFKLRTAREYTLPSVEALQTLLGVNNIWSDTGDTSVTYRADTKLYIDKQLAASQTLMELIITANREEAMKATKAYTTGNLMIVNGTLYRATTSIANGATLTVGTNVTATTIATELANLA